MAAALVEGGPALFPTGERLSSAQARRDACPGQRPESCGQGYIVVVRELGLDVHNRVAQFGPKRRDRTGDRDSLGRLTGRRAGRNEGVKIGSSDSDAPRSDSHRWQLTAVDPIPYRLGVELEQFSDIVDRAEGPPRREIFQLSAIGRNRVSCERRFVLGDVAPRRRPVASDRSSSRRLDAGPPEASCAPGR